MNQCCTQRVLYTPPPLSSLLKLKHLCPRGLSVPVLSSWLHPSPSYNHSSLSPSLRASHLIRREPEPAVEIRSDSSRCGMLWCSGIWGGSADTGGVVPFTPGAANVLLLVEALQLLIFSTIRWSFRGASDLKTIVHNGIPGYMQYLFSFFLMLCTQDCGERSHYTNGDHRTQLATQNEAGSTCDLDGTASCDWRQIKWRKLGTTSQHANNEELTFFM